MLGGGVDAATLVAALGIYVGLIFVFYAKEGGSGFGLRRHSPWP